MAAEPGTESVADARQAVVDARKDVEKELDDLGLATRAALDIPAKIRRNPVRTVGVGAGAAFLLLGGPRRVLKQVEQRVFPKRRYRRLTPAEIDRAIDRLGEEDREAARAHVERDFASYLEKNHPREQPNARKSFWGTYDTLMAIVGTAAARELVKRFLEVPQEARQEAAEKDVKAAQAGAKAALADATAATVKKSADSPKKSAENAQANPAKSTK
jgi:hypothetical protein